ncbi:MAG TPA: hypothetical protein VGJ07_03275 [Rugosimonospora sp.]
MRSRRLAAVLAAGTLAAMAGAAAPAHAQPDGQTTDPGPACTPTWRIVDAPALPAAYSIGFNGGTVDAISPDNVWIPGTLDGNLMPGTTWVGHWNGHSITTEPAVPKSPATSQVMNGASFDSATDGWIVGGQYVNATRGGLYPQPFSAHWDGHRWTTVPLPPSPHLGQTIALPTQVAALSPTDVWAVGAETVGLTTTGSLVEHWDGSQWSVVPNPASNAARSILTAMKAISASDVWAVGRQVTADGAIVPLVERYDGTAWHLVDVPFGSPASELSGISATGPDDVWVVGADTAPDSGGFAEPLVEHFDGTSWAAFPDPAGIGNVELNGVYAATPTDVWVTEYVPDHTAVGMLHYDGRTWTQVPWPAPAEYGEYSWAMSIDGTGPNDVWALGGVTVEPGSTTNHTELRIAHLTCGGS